MKAAFQTTASQPWLPIGVPTISARMVSMTWVMGWFSAKARRGPGMPAVGTKAEEAKVKGKTSTNPIHCTASTLLAKSPKTAEIQENAKVKSKRVPTKSNHSVKVAVGRKPTKNATKI